MGFHVEALFALDANGDLFRVNEVSGAPAPRLFLGRTAEGPVLRFRHDVDADIRRELESTAHREIDLDTALDSPTDPLPYQAILARSAPIQKTWRGPAFHFPPELPVTTDVTFVTESNAQILESFLKEWMSDAHTVQPIVVMTVDGHAVSVCCSVRQTNMAHEAG